MYIKVNLIYSSCSSAFHQFSHWTLCMRACVRASVCISYVSIICVLFHLGFMHKNIKHYDDGCTLYDTHALHKISRWDILNLTISHIFSLFVTYSLALRCLLLMLFIFMLTKKFPFSSIVFVFSYLVLASRCLYVQRKWWVVSGAHSTHWLLWIFLGFIIILSPEQWNECVCVYLISSFCELKKLSIAPMHT